MRFVLAGNCFGRGGIQTHLRWTAILLRQAGHEVALVPTLPRRTHETPLHELEQRGVLVADSGPECESGRWGKARRLPRLAKFVRGLRPHVYFALGAGWVPAVLRPIAASQARAIYFEVLSGNWYHRRFDPRLAIAACFDEVVGQSPRVGAALRRAFSWRQPVPSIPAIPEPLERTAVIPKTARRRVARGNIRAAVFSRLDVNKRAFWLVQQWEKLRDVVAELHIHGAGDDQARIQSWIAAHGLQRSVYCHGTYPNGQDYVDLLRSYDLTLLPTIGDEGAPLVLLESMACGVPFVASDAGGIPDYCRGNPDCRISSNRLDNFVDIVRDMADQLEQGRIDQERLQVYYRTNFRHELLTECWLQFLTGSSPAPFVWPTLGRR